MDDMELQSGERDPEQLYVSIVIPDLFKGFVVRDPPLNIYYKDTKKASEQWLSSACDLLPEMCEKAKMVDASYFCGIMAPEASTSDFRILCDWANWVFPFDDMFDDGELRSRPDTARLVIDGLISSMDGIEYSGPKHTMISAHADILARLTDVIAPPPCDGRRSEFEYLSSHDSRLKRNAETRGRYVTSMKTYATGVLCQVLEDTNEHTASVYSMINMRRKVIGISPFYQFVELVHGLRIPSNVFEDPMIQKLQVLGEEMILLANDIISYAREEREGVTHNLVTVYRLQGLSAQDAFESVDRLLDERFFDWNNSVRQLPTWNDNIDQQISLYIQGIQRVVQANVSWSHHTARYKAGKLEEPARQIRVLANPRYLKEHNFKGHHGEAHE
ncbi:uncharacterized protein FFB14_15497 [Fusarium fujikuroi]|nr:uncharacterized protein FFB14_15497 [Fusarium fujikuroi]